MDNMIRTVFYNGMAIEYILTIKKVRNINMRINPNCTVRVSANKWVSKKRIDEFVVSKGRFVLDNLEKFKKKNSEKPSRVEYLTGEKFEILGMKINLVVIQKNEEGVFFDGANLFLGVSDQNNFKRKEKLYNKFIDNICENIFIRVVNEIYPIFEAYKIEFPTIKMKTMKSRWGSCADKKGIITLNKHLIEKPRECIEYVVLHEFCHYIHADHSKRFYKLLEGFMPDWKKRRSML